MDKEKIEDLKSVIYEQRLLVFIEQEPQSNKYCQVIFTQDEFKKLSDTIGKENGLTEDGLEKRIMCESEEEYTLPDLQSYQEK